MRKKKLPQPFQVEEMNFRICFSAPSLESFLMLMTGWVLTVGTHTGCRAVAHEGL